jgi:hypothetical protein
MSVLTSSGLGLSFRGLVLDFIGNLDKDSRTIILVFFVHKEVQSYERWVFVEVLFLCLIFHVPRLC